MANVETGRSLLSAFKIKEGSDSVVGQCCFISERIAVFTVKCSAPIIQELVDICTRAQRQSNVTGTSTCVTLRDL